MTATQKRQKASDINRALQNLKRSVELDMLPFSDGKELDYLGEVLKSLARGQYFLTDYRAAVTARMEPVHRKGGSR